VLRAVLRSDIVLLLGLLLLAAAAAAILAQPACTSLDARELEYFRTRRLWQCAFDALSAACGVGLLTSDLRADYTDVGRWVLLGAGFLGALLYVTSFARALARSQQQAGRSLASNPLMLALLFCVLQALALGGLVTVDYVRFRTVDVDAVLLRGVSAFASLGWSDAFESRANTVAVAVVAGLGALGCLPWMMLIPGLRRHINARTTLISVASYALFLAALAGLICAAETPRGGAYAGSAPVLASKTTPARYGRALVQSVSASGAGIATEPLTDRGVSETTKVALAGALLVGGLPVSAAGGISWVFTIAALVGVATALGLRRRRGRGGGGRWYTAGLACLLLYGMLIVATATGLLLLETWTASRFQPAHTFADALLDAASAVCGGNLTSGLTESITNESLSSGIRLGENRYIWAMVWMMLAMICGRVLAVSVLCRLACGDRRQGD